jgi:exo-beta-1,3-glucanase (GH17 family)
VIDRFFSLMDALSALAPVKRVSHVLIGNEVDGYLSAHPDELKAFSNFYRQSAERLHQKMPWVKVGTIITFNSLASHPDIFDTITPNSDFICYTYYPTDEANPNWQMRSPAEVQADIRMMAKKANSLPFAFSEIGYPSSVENNSSELKQKQFVEAMFDALKPYKDQGKLEFLFYHGLYDYPTDFCGQYARQQGIDSKYLCGFMNNLGLRSYETGQPKQAWDAFVNKLKSW